MVLWLRVQIALTEDLGSIASTHMVTHNSPVGSCFPWAPLHGAHTYLRAHTHKLK